MSTDAGATEPVCCGAPVGGQPAPLAVPAAYCTEPTELPQVEPEKQPPHWASLQAAALCPRHGWPSGLPQEQPVQVRVSFTATTSEWGTGSSGGHATSSLPACAAQRLVNGAGDGSQSQAAPPAQKTPSVAKLTGKEMVEAEHFPAAAFN